MLGKPSMYLNSRRWPLGTLCVAMAWTRQVLLPTSCIPHLFITASLTLSPQQCSGAANVGGARQSWSQSTSGRHHVCIKGVRPLGVSVIGKWS